MSRTRTKPATYIDPEVNPTLGRPVKPPRPKATGFFGTPEPSWRDHWWDMPSFEMHDTTPAKTISINFLTEADLKAFVKLTGIKLTMRSDSGWFPHQAHMGNEVFYWDGPKTDSTYPICIPSKGRAQHQITVRALKRMGVSYRIFVEETEADEYMEHNGEDVVEVMPFHDLGQGSIPARNYIWQWAKAHGYKRHWCVDDNIRKFGRLQNNRRLSVYGGGFFPAVEQFVDRYVNVPLAALQHKGFVLDRPANQSPILWNSRCYSCNLIQTDIDDKIGGRWRGKYNEDTDLSLRVLKAGYCTLNFKALHMGKMGTAGSRNSTPLPGGNTDHVYNTGDHRLAFAKSLAEQHPDVVKVVFKFNRWHHTVDYSPFAGNVPILREGVVPYPMDNEWGMKLIRGKKSGSAE